jgi:DNA-binding GntR family transcriptional regulator
MVSCRECRWIGERGDISNLRRARIRTGEISHRFGFWTISGEPSFSRLQQHAARGCQTAKDSIEYSELQQMAVQRRSLKDQVRQQILERILKGRYLPGQRLREVALAEELNTSPIPVREALRELESLRIVESEAYKGVRVRQVTPTELVEAYELRAVLESYAAEKGGHSFKGNSQGLRKRYLAMVTAARAKDIEAYTAQDLPFHRLIVEAAKNAFLLRAWDALGFEIRTRIFLASKEFDMVRIAQLHEPIVDALERGETKQAAQLLREHSLGFAAQMEALREGGVQQPNKGGRRAHRDQGLVSVSDGCRSPAGGAGRADRAKRIADAKPRARR